MSGIKIFSIVKVNKNNEQPHQISLMVHVVIFDGLKNKHCISNKMISKDNITAFKGHSLLIL